MIFLNLGRYCSKSFRISFPFSEFVYATCLDDIEGIGPARRKALMRHFQSLEAIREADVDALADVPSMNRAAAEKVWKFFH